MLKNLFLVMVASFLATSFVSAQRVVDTQNCREGETHEYCLEHKLFANLLNNPEFVKQWDKDQKQLKLEESGLVAKSKGDIPAKGIIYRIPVVFHVLHNGGPENVSKAQIDDALAILNRDFRRLNADANNVYTPFQGNPADIEVEFVYATKAPNGQCFSGITRTQSPMTSQGDDGDLQVDAIIVGNDVYNGPWPGNKYLNVFICADLISGASGYTYRPSNFIGGDMKNGIWILHDYLGAIGTGSTYRSRSLTHEVGHWLNLPHVWGGTNNPGLASNCGSGPNDDDGVDDTPECIGNTTCQVTSNTCNLDFAYWGFDQVDPVENYMNYSFCSKMFTPGQATKMRTALNSSVGGRNNVVTSSNLTATGADSNLFVCAAAFTVSSQFVCVGESVNFYDASYNNVKGWTWTFNGATPASSTIQNPTVAYNAPGTYSVTLVATDSVTNQTTTKTNYVTVLPVGVTLPYSEGFESYNSLNDPTSFWRPTGTASTTFEITNTAGASGSKSIKLRNYAHSSGTFSELYSNPFDLSGLSSGQSVTFSFRYSHRKRNASDYEILRIQASNDCGGSWATRKTMLSSSLSTEVVGSEWTPGPNDWVQVHVTNINSSFYVPNLQMKFSFQSGSGNNLFIDDINLYEGGPSSVGIEEASNLENLSLFPNPADDELNVQFSVNGNADVQLFVQDITGKQISSNLVKATTGQNLVMINTQELASGMYFMNVVQGSSRKTLQFVVK